MMRALGQVGVWKPKLGQMVQNCPKFQATYFAIFQDDVALVILYPYASVRKTHLAPARQHFRYGRRLRLGLHLVKLG